MLIFDWFLGRHRVKDESDSGPGNQAQVDQNSDDILLLYANKRDKLSQKNSIEEDAGSLQLVGDEVNPSAHKFYGIDKDGNRVFKHQEHIFFTSSRFYLVQGRWYGWDDTYGINHYNAFQNYQNGVHTVAPNPNYSLRGFRAPFNCKIKEVVLSHNRMNSNGNRFHLALVKQTKTPGSQTITNSVLEHDTAGKLWDSNQVNDDIIYEINEDFDKGQILSVMVNKSSGNGTDYLMSDVTIIYERR